MAFGAQHVGVLVVVSLMVFAAAVIAVDRRGWSAVPRPALILFGIAGYTALQATPLPEAWVQALSPRAAETWRGAFAVLGRRGYMSLSLDRGATLVEVLKWAAYGAAFIAAAAVGAWRGMARGLLLPLGLALLVSAVTVGHGLVGATTVYGFYEPTVPRSIWHTGPLLNPNHLASFINFGMFCGVGLLAARRKVVPAWMLGLAIAFLIPNAIVAGSRGGVLGLVVGLVVFFALLPKARRGENELGPLPTRILLAVLAGVFLVAIGFTALLGSEKTVQQLYETNVDKLRLLSWCKSLVIDFPWFGVGRGAFESTFTAYRSGGGNEIYTHPENLPAQWLGEWGIPAALVAAVGLSWSLRPRQLGVRWSVASTGVVAALAAIIAQNFVDFGLEIPGICLSVVVALGVCWGHARAYRIGSGSLEEAMRVTDRRRPAAGARVELRNWPLMGILCAVPCVLIALNFGAGFQPLVLERRALAAAYESLSDTSTEAELASLRAAVERAVYAHPSEPYFYRMGAVLAWRGGRDPMSWLGRALERGPYVGRTHLLLARVLAERRVFHQALLELRLAATYDPNLIPSTTRAALSWARDPEDLLRAVPEGAAGIPMLVAAARSITEPGTKEVILAELVQRDSRRSTSLELLANFLVQELERPQTSQYCTLDRVQDCRARAERVLRELEALAPRSTEGILLRARLLFASGDPNAAAALLAERCSWLGGGGRTRCLAKRLDISYGTKDLALFAAAAKDFLADGCADSEQCATVYEKVADMSANRGDWGMALDYYERAARERSDDRLWMKVARAGVRVRALARVSNALRRVRASASYEPEFSRLMKAAHSSGLAPP